MLSTCHTAGLIFNSDKFQFGQETVEFAGLDVTMEGVKPSKKFLEAIKAYPRPDTLSEARSFFGMINRFPTICIISKFHLENTPRLFILMDLDGRYE